MVFTAGKRDKNARFRMDAKTGGFKLISEAQVNEQPEGDKPQVPENPGIRKQAFSTYGVSIPVSIGRRAVTGNVIDATDITPVLIPGKTTVTEIKVPIYYNDGGID